MRVRFCQQRIQIFGSGTDMIGYGRLCVAIMDADIGTAIDPDCLAALKRGFVRMERVAA